MLVVSKKNDNLAVNLLSRLFMSLLKKTLGLAHWFSQQVQASHF